MSDSQWGFGLEIGFIDHFNVRLVTIFNYSASADFHTLQITTAHAKGCQSAAVSTGRSLKIASNSGDSSTDQVFSSQTPLQLPTDSVTTLTNF
jgi:hypothetical protein